MDTKEPISPLTNDPSENPSGKEPSVDIPHVESPYAGKTLTTWEQVAISVFWLGTNALWGALLLVMLPGEVAAIAPIYRVPAVGLLASLAAFVALVVPLVVGAFSDRCASNWGRRRPFIATGVAINV